MKTTTIRKTWKNQRGYTFMELIVVISIVGLLAAVGLSRMKNSPTAAQRANAARIVVNDFRYAQEIAMTYGRSVRIDVEPGLNLYSLKWNDTNEYLPSITGNGNFIRRFGENEFQDVHISDSDLSNNNLRFKTNGEPISNGVKLTEQRIAISLDNTHNVVIIPETGLVKIYSQ
ncbi:MAG: type II secretion system protein [Calditrichaeota bacterium]|nr:MAG: type II secretion system protein [Calditrichota bacterium]